MPTDFRRRNFLTGAAIAGAGLVSGFRYEDKSEMEVPQLANPQTSTYDIMGNMLNYRKIDAYANAFSLNSGQAEVQIRNADRFHIEKLIIAVPVAKTMGANLEEIQKYNSIVLNAVKTYPDRFLGQFIVNPVHTIESIEEIKRCIDLGFTGMKLFNHVKINDPVCFPLIESFIDYKMVIHVHGESQLGVGGYRMKYDVQNNPAISVPEDFADIAKRYPEAMFQYAHIGGGSDWEYACKSFADLPNIYVDTGGSNNEEGMIDFAVEHLGEDRVLFGCDSSFYQGIGKILASNLNENQKKKVFFENYNTILSKSGNGIQ